MEESDFKGYSVVLRITCRVIWVLLLFSFEAFGQYTNEPDLVCPVLNEFTKEAQKRGKDISGLDYLDSIIFTDIPNIVDGDFTTKVYGYRHRIGKRMWIEIDNSFKVNKVSAERTILHELGHVMDRPHIETKHFSDPMSKEIMSRYRYPYYISRQELWAIKQRFYGSL